MHIQVSYMFYRSRDQRAPSDHGPCMYLHSCLFAQQNSTKKYCAVTASTIAMASALHVEGGTPLPLTVAYVVRQALTHQFTKVIYTGHRTPAGCMGAMYTQKDSSFPLCMAICCVLSGPLSCWYYSGHSGQKEKKGDQGSSNGPKDE